MSSRSTCASYVPGTAGSQAAGGSPGFHVTRASSSRVEIPSPSESCEPTSADDRLSFPPAHASTSDGTPLKFASATAKKEDVGSVVSPSRWKRTVWVPEVHPPAGGDA